MEEDLSPSPPAPRQQQRNVLQATQLDGVGVADSPILREYVTDCGDKTVYFSIRVPEVVPGGHPIERIFVITDAALYTVPQTAVHTGIFFNSRYPFSNLTQVLVIDSGDEPAVVQFNGFRMQQAEQTLFVLRFTDNKRMDEALRTLCHLFSDLPILKKIKIAGNFHDVPYVTDSGISGTRFPSDPRADSIPLPRSELRARLSCPPVPEDVPAQERLKSVLANCRRHVDASDDVLSPGRGGGERGERGEEEYGAGFQLKPAVMSQDHHFEAQRRQLRELLFDHDLTNLQLRASLSLLEDEIGPKHNQDHDAGSRRGDDETVSLPFSGPAESRSEAASARGTDHEDHELARRREQQRLEEQRRRHEEAQKRAEVRRMLARLDRKVEAQVRKRTKAQVATSQRIAQRHSGGDQRTRQLNEERARLKQQHVREERELARRREEECKQLLARIEEARGRRAAESAGRVRAASHDREDGGAKVAFGRGMSSANSGGYCGRPVTAPDDALIVGDEIHAEYTRWRQTGGLAHGDGGWQEADSRHLITTLRECLQDLSEWGGDTGDVARVKVMLGKVEGELRMLRSRQSRGPARKPAKPSTRPEPFALSESNKRKSTRFTVEDMEAALKQTRQESDSRLQALYDRLAQSVEAPSPPLSPRELCQLR
eukprot:Hpha_TRINITY_DN28084_c0_g1::TRINITY_DN28084_c0_g1_i1::g.42613::m.42613